MIKNYEKFPTPFIILPTTPKTKCPLPCIIPVRDLNLIRTSNVHYLWT